MSLARTGCALGLVVTALALTLTSAPSMAGEAVKPEPSLLPGLSRLAPGTYVRRGEGFAAAPRELSVPLFIQADAYARVGHDTRLSLVVGTDSREEWQLQVRLVRAEAVPARTPSRSAAPRPIDVTMTGYAGRVRQVKELTLPAGRYELSAALSRKAAGGAPVVTYVRQTLTVPSFEPSGLTASPVVLGESATTRDQQGEPQPFTFGSTVLAPATINAFRPSDRLDIALRVLGWKGDEAVKPDLSVEYVFRQTLNGQARFFNRVKAQDLNASTLGKAFDGRQGVAAAGLALPLSAFPAGDFTVIVRVHDKRTKATVEQSAAFTVTPM